MIFPVVDTEQRPDLLVWNEDREVTWMIELTVSWETNIDDAFEYKMRRYAELKKRCEEEGWKTECLPIEVGARGYVGHRVYSLLSKLSFNS